MVFAGIAYCALSTPFSTLRTRLISQSKYNNSILVAVHDIVENQSYRVLYSGFLIGLCYVFDSMIQLLIYEELKAYLLYDEMHIISRNFIIFWIGVISRGISISITYSYRVIQTRMMSGAGSLIKAIGIVYRTYGLKGFYKGYSMCMARNLPPAGFMFMLLECFKVIFREFFFNR